MARNAPFDGWPNADRNAHKWNPTHDETNTTEEEDANHKPNRRAWHIIRIQTKRGEDDTPPQCAQGSTKPQADSGIGSAGRVRGLVHMHGIVHGSRTS